MLSFSLRGQNCCLSVPACLAHMSCIRECSIWKLGRANAHDRVLIKEERSHNEGVLTDYPMGLLLVHVFSGQTSTYVEEVTTLRVRRFGI